MAYKTLYAKDASGTIRQWSIDFKNDKIIIQHGVHQGAQQGKIEDVPEGKAGRSRLEQIISRMDSRINSKKDAGYVENIEEAKNNKRVNSQGLLRPMLAKKLSDIKKENFNHCYVQHKYDGNRCLVTKQNGKLIAYSRNGKIMNNLEHILKDIYLPEGCTIDGELYCHGLPLQQIVSLVKRKQPQTELIRYHVYDLISNDPYGIRHNKLQDLMFNGSSSLVPTILVNSFEQVQSCFKSSRNKGYEGAIIRFDDCGYEDGKRSKSLIKVKHWFDDEFRVVDIVPSREGWAILVCQCRTRLFKVSAPGTMNEKFNIMNKKDEYIGRFVTVEYAQFTKDMVPFHPVAIRFREED